MTSVEGFMWVVLTVYLEARGEPPAGQKAVVKVILNRAKKRNWPLANIIFSRKQFSCWNDGIDGLVTKRKGFSVPANWITELVTLASVYDNCIKGVNEWQAGNKLQGATHYYNPEDVKGGKPYWADSMEYVVTIDDHVFLKEI